MLATLITNDGFMKQTQVPEDSRTFRFEELISLDPVWKHAPVNCSCVVQTRTRRFQRQGDTTVFYEAQ